MDNRTGEHPPIRIGFIGAGVMSNWAIYPALYTAPVVLAAVCDVDEARARGTAQKYGARWYTDSNAMFSQEELDAVLIWMPPQPRQQLVLAALATGYHVLIPKPPATSLAACIELAEAAQAAGRHLSVDYQTRYSAAIRRACAVMQRSEFGKLTQLSMSFCSGAYDAARTGPYDDHLHAFLLDFCVHYFDLARFLGGEMREIGLYHTVSDSGVAVALSILFESGAVGTLQMNSERIWWRNYDHIEITGQGEYLVLDGIWNVKHYTPNHNTFTENYRDERSVELTGDAHVLNEFARALQEGREPPMSIQDSVRTMQVYQAVYDAVRAGRQGVITIPNGA